MVQQLDPLGFPLHGTRLIEASAGTGKTYTIAALYLRLVLGHGGPNGFSRPLSPPEILVVTFTNAATEELRDRIRNRLSEAAAFFREQDDGDDFLQNLRADYPAGQWPGNARLLDQAAQWMDESAIHTIHAWCQRMLRQHAFDSGSLFDLTLEAGDQALLEEAACDYWRRYLYPQPAERLAELISLSGCATPQALLKKVRPLLEAQESAAPAPFEMLGQRCQAIEAARRVWEADFDNAVAALRQAQADKRLNGNKYRKASLEKWLDQLKTWVKENGPLPDGPVLQKLSQTGLEAGLAKNKTAPVHPAYEAFDALSDALDGLQVDAALFSHAALDIGRRYRREKQRRAQMDFDDLLTRLHAALKRPGTDRLAGVIRKQFPVALIDEFQDTDPVQYGIFSSIYRNQPDAGLFMIGDPKQAIYAFRGADIHTYLAARRDTQGRHYTLGTNFRSTEGVVAAVNRMFLSAAAHPAGPFLFKDQIPFEPVAAHGRRDRLVISGEPACAMTFWQLQQTGPINKTGEDGYLARMAEAAASEVVRLLNLAEEQPPKAGFEMPTGGLQALRPADIAILVRDVSEARAIRQALDARQVRSVYLSDKESVFEGGEAASLLYILRACAEPEQERSLKTALATPVLDLPLSRLDLLNRDELAWEAEVERFRRYQRIWQRQGVLPMLRALLREFGVPGRLLATSDGERVLTNLLHLAELLQAAAAQLDGEQAVIRWLAEQMVQPPSDIDEQILRLESDEELIRVVTIHKSKGLEYPLVFLPFICTFRQVTARNSPVVGYHDEDGRLKRVQKPAADDLAAADRERLAEDLRLLYVALTRSRYACWLGLGVMGKPSKLHLSGLGYLLSGGREVQTADLTEKLTALKGGCAHIAVAPLPDPRSNRYRPRPQAVELAPALTFGGTVPRNWWITSYSGILGGAMMPEAPMPEVDARETPPYFPDSAAEDLLQEAESEPELVPEVAADARSIHRFPRGPHPGTFLHNLLEWAADEGFAELAGDRQRIYEKIQALCQVRDWTGWVEMLTDWLVQLLQTPLILPDDQGTMRLADLSAQHYQAELEFLFAAHGVDTRILDAAVTAAVMPRAVRPQLREHTVNGMLKGFIDLVFRHNGRYYVLDYKSNHLGETGQAYVPHAMAQSMLEHRYDLQYVLYTLALHRLLKARLRDYDYQRDVGGVMYLFLRGVNADGRGVYGDKPPLALIARLDDYFAGKENHRAA